MYIRQVHGNLCLEGAASVAVLPAMVLDLHHRNADMDWRVGMTHPVICETAFLWVVNDLCNILKF